MLIGGIDKLSVCVCVGGGGGGDRYDFKALLRLLATKAVRRPENEATRLLVKSFVWNLEGRIIVW